MIDPRYYIPPQYYPFLKKLGDDTPELKPLGLNGLSSVFRSLVSLEPVGSDGGTCPPKGMVMLEKGGRQALV